VQILPTAAFPVSPSVQDSLYGFPRLFTVTSESFYFLFFSVFSFYTFFVVGSVR